MGQLLKKKLPYFKKVITFKILPLNLQVTLHIFIVWDDKSRITNFEQMKKSPQAGMQNIYLAVVHHCNAHSDPA